ncbi:hypothetical protein Droror1_Dr00005218 [Drosera rotundifolia]
MSHTQKSGDKTYRPESPDHSISTIHSIPIPITIPFSPIPLKLSTKQKNRARSPLASSSSSSSFLVSHLKGKHTQNNKSTAKIGERTFICKGRIICSLSLSPPSQEKETKPRSDLVESDRIESHLSVEFGVQFDSLLCGLAQKGIK